MERFPPSATALRPSSARPTARPCAKSAPAPRPGELGVGQELDARLQTPLSSQTAEVEDRFEATTLVDLYQGSTLMVPAGSVLRGVVSGVDRASRTDRRGSLTLSFDQMTVAGRTYRIRASVTKALEGPGVKGEVGKMTTGAAAGAIIGGILGGFQGAMAGILIGGGGSLLALPGTNVRVEAGTVLRVRFDAPVLLGDRTEVGPGVPTRPLLKGTTAARSETAPYRPYDFGAWYERRPRAVRPGLVTRTSILWTLPSVWGSKPSRYWLWSSWATRVKVGPRSSVSFSSK